VKITKVMEVTQKKIGEELISGRKELLAVLERAASEPVFLARLAQDPREVIREYYSLTAAERAALASGDIRGNRGLGGQVRWTASYLTVVQAEPRKMVDVVNCTRDSGPQQG